MHTPIPQLIMRPSRIVTSSTSSGCINSKLSGISRLTIRFPAIPYGSSLSPQPAIGRNGLSEGGTSGADVWCSCRVARWRSQRSRRSSCSSTDVRPPGLSRDLGLAPISTRALSWLSCPVAMRRRRRRLPIGRREKVVLASVSSLFVAFQFLRLAQKSQSSSSVATALPMT